MQFRTPPHLSPEARAFWERVDEEYELTSDGALYLRAALGNWDRAQLARETIAREGLTVEGRKHPAIDIEKQAYGLFLRAMRQLGLDVIPPGSLPVSAGWEVGGDMPRVRRKGFRQRGLSDAQREILLFGMALMAYGQEGFSSGDEARAAWQQYREQIMADLSCAGRQPAAFYRFDLNINVPRRWYDELIVLLDKRLISAEEAVRIEASNQMLSGEHQEAFCAAFDDAGAIIQMRLDADGAGTLVKKFEAAARWHQWRGRPEVAERYTARADLLRAWMGDGNLSRGFNYDGNHYSA